MSGGLLRTPAPARAPAPDRLRIGLVNSMPPSAAAATWRQFASALGGGVDLLGFRPDWADAGSGLSIAAPDGRRRGLEALFGAWPDALVVTGAEPKGGALSEERLYPEVVRILEEAQRRRTPVLWSCLAAHAAVHRLAGLDRERLPEKLSGVFEIRPLPGSGLDGVPATGLSSPHSRCNTIAPEALEGAGFRILTAGSLCGADLFEDPEAQFLFLQGHPEYEAASLLLEYRRDLARALAAEADRLPRPPVDYFPAPLEAELMTLSRSPRSAARASRASSTLKTLAGAAPARRWSGWSAKVFERWLTRISARRPVRTLA